MDDSKVVHIEGSYGEGGGQIIRTCLSLAALTGKTVEIANVRAGRPKPGLQPQHLTAVRAVAEICRADVEGAEIGSTHLVFSPGQKPCPGSYRFEIGTAGATTLVAQSVLLPLALASAKSQLSITGGTHVPFAPIAEYLDAVYLAALRHVGLSARCTYPRAGYYPKGGGELKLEVSPLSQLHPLDVTERGRLLTLKAYIITSQLPEHVGGRGASTVEKFMGSVGRAIQVEQIERPSSGPGAAVIVVAECEAGFAGFSSLGKLGKPMERVADEACQAFMVWWKSGAGCDEHLADQLVLPVALACGEGRWTVPAVSEHLKTVVWVVKQFIRVQIRLAELPTGLIQVTMRGA